jgi:hypothetical protein
MVLPVRTCTYALLVVLKTGKRGWSHAMYILCATAEKPRESLVAPPRNARLHSIFSTTSQSSSRISCHTGSWNESVLAEIVQKTLDLCAVRTTAKGLTMIVPTGTARIIAIVGRPIAQVRSPTVVNLELASRGIDAVMIPCHVTPEALPNFLATIRGWENAAGAVVTMPHKSVAASFVHRCRSRRTVTGAGIR